MSDPYDPFLIATEEMRFCAELNVKIIAWELGMQVFIELAKRTGLHTLHERSRTGQLFGIPYTVRPDLDPWAIVAIKSP